MAWWSLFLTFNIIQYISIALSIYPLSASFFAHSYKWTINRKAVPEPSRSSWGNKPKLRMQEFGEHVSRLREIRRLVHSSPPNHFLLELDLEWVIDVRCWHDDREESWWEELCVRIIIPTIYRFRWPKLPFDSEGVWEHDCIEWMPCHFPTNKKIWWRVELQHHLPKDTSQIRYFHFQGVNDILNNHSQKMNKCTRT